MGINAEIRYSAGCVRYATVREIRFDDARRRRLLAVLVRSVASGSTLFRNRQKSVRRVPGL